MIIKLSIGPLFNRGGFFTIWFERVSDNVVGQIQRYMGYVKDELIEEGQNVKGVIIGFDDDIKLQRALSVTTNIEFYKYKVDFKLYQ